MSFQGFAEWEGGGGTACPQSHKNAEVGKPQIPRSQLTSTPMSTMPCASDTSVAWLFTASHCSRGLSDARVLQAVLRKGEPDRCAEPL